MITMNQVNKALKAAGYDAEIVHGNGYYYFAGCDAECLYETGVYGVYRLNALSVDEWVSEFKVRHQRCSN